MSSPAFILRLLPGLAAMLLLAGCIPRQTPQDHHFSLLTLEQLEGEAMTPPRPELALGIGPISLPDVLKREQIVTREQGNRYAFSEYHRWAGRLEEDLAQVLGENLERLLGTDNVALYPWRPPFEPTHRVIVEVLRFDGALGGEAVLSARWSVADADGRAYLVGGKSEVRKPVEGEGYEDLVRAQSLALGELSREIARVLQTLNKKG